MSGNRRYVYSVAIWDSEEDKVLGEGSGPASHVIANLERMIMEIRVLEELENPKPKRPNPVEVGQEVGREFFEAVAAGQRPADEWPMYLLEKAEAEIRELKPDVTDEEVTAALEVLKSTQEFGIAVQIGLQSGQAVERMNQIKALRVQNGAPGEDPNMPGTRLTNPTTVVKG